MYVCPFTMLIKAFSLRVEALALDIRQREVLATLDTNYYVIKPFLSFFLDDLFLAIIQSKIQTNLQSF